MVKINSILLIDDDEITNLISKRLIDKLNLSQHIVIAVNGDDGLRKLISFCREYTDCPKLIFLDINMPVMDGFEFLEEFKKINFPNKQHVRIVILTTSTHRFDMEKVKQLGIHDFINKPLTEDKLRQITEKYFC